MIGLDSNVLVRYLVQDDPAQCARVDRLFERGIDGDRSFFIGTLVLCEAAWVLSSCYDIDRDGIVGAFAAVLTTAQFEIEHKELVRWALDSFAEKRGDFADCLLGLVAREAGCDTTVTFDRGLRRNATFRLL